MSRKIDTANKTRLNRDVVHLAGIVHDMGKILFERYANAEFHQALTQAQEKNIDAIPEERTYVGISHDEAGAWLACTPVREHRAF